MSNTHSRREGDKRSIDLRGIEEPHSAQNLGLDRGQGWGFEVQSIPATRKKITTGNTRVCVRRFREPVCMADMEGGTVLHAQGQDDVHERAAAARRLRVGGSPKRIIVLHEGVFVQDGKQTLVRLPVQVEEEDLVGAGQGRRKSGRQTCAGRGSGLDVAGEDWPAECI